MGKYRVKSWNL